MAKQKARLAPVLPRIKAFIVDLFIVAIPLFYVTTYLILGSKEALWANQVAIGMIWLAYGVITSAFFARTAQTPGYKMQGIYLVDVHSGRKIGFVRALMRFCCFIAAGASAAGILLCFFRKDRLNLHDILTSTAAVERKDGAHAKSDA